MEGTRNWLDDLKLRVGYGQVGNSEVPRITNYAYEFTTSPSTTNYDISGANTASATGFRLQRFGNPDTKWEAVEDINIGIDATVLSNKLNFNVEFYQKKTTDMLMPAAYSSLAGEAAKPYINFGDIKNTGVDATINYRDNSGDWSWDVSLTVGHYKNEVLRLSEADDYTLWGYGTRLDGQPATRTTKGRPISEFYGYVVDGFYENAQDVLDRQPLGQTLSPEEAKAWVGRFKFADTNNDGVLNDADRVILGSPHPDLYGGLNVNAAYKGFDFTMFWYYSLGNEMFNNTVSFTDFNLFNGNRSKKMLYESWKLDGDNSNAKLPLLSTGDTYSRSYMNSYYIEDASYLKLKNIVIGYTLPKSLLKAATISNLRLYVQAENILTFTKYTGLTPENTNANITETQTDLRRGVDMGGWPNIMNFLFGVNFAF